MNNIFTVAATEVVRGIAYESWRKQPVVKVGAVAPAGRTVPIDFSQSQAGVSLQQGTLIGNAAVEWQGGKVDPDKGRPKIVVAPSKISDHALVMVKFEPFIGGDIDVRWATAREFERSQLPALKPYIARGYGKCRRGKDVSHFLLSMPPRSAVVVERSGEVNIPRDKDFVLIWEGSKGKGEQPTLIVRRLFEHNQYLKMLKAKSEAAIS